MAKPLVIRNQKKEFITFNVLVLGAGGNGSHFIRGLCQMIRTYLNKGRESRIGNFNVYLTICDGDKIESKNTANQLYDQSEVGDYKTVSLVERYGDHYDIEINCVTEYVKDLKMLNALFPTFEMGKTTQEIRIVVGMIDNNKTRQLIDSYFYMNEVADLIYLDAAIEGVEILNKPEHQYTDEDWELIHSTGFGGQVGIGVKMAGQVLLEPITRVYQNILEDAKTAFPGESCGALIVNNPQRLATNQMAAQIALSCMNNLFHTGSILTHYTNFNAAYGGSRPVFITDEVIEMGKKIISN